MKTILSLAIVGNLAASAAEPLALIPQPVSVEAGKVGFAIHPDSAILFDDGLESEAGLLAADLEKQIGLKIKTGSSRAKFSGKTEILLSLSGGEHLPVGGYILKTNNGGRLIIRGKDAAGVFHGTRTLLQLLPARTMEGLTPRVPAVTITDHPRFAWRGMMLDVGRHFQPVADIKRFIDWMAFHKLNTFHWHLTDDQGWRIEIKKYPKLTEIGAFRESSPPYGNRDSDDGVRYGGFYTQEQIKDVVAYAAARHITVVPEIEMPGHAAAAITAYPELGNSDIPGFAPKVMTRWGVHPYIFSPKEETFTFLEDVLGEVCDLFPSKFIHIGGDEAPKTQWKQSKLAQEVMKREGLKNECIGGHLPLEKVYSYNPTFVAENPAQEKQILGTQAQLWAEYGKDMKKIEYMAFPRIAALAEVAWTPLALKNFDDFSKRLEVIMKHYEAGGIHFAKPVPAPIRKTQDGSSVATSLGITIE